MSQKFFRILPEKTNFQFVKNAKIPFVLSMLFLALCTWSIFARGINYGVDFQGGTEVIVHLPTVADVSEVRTALLPAGYTDANVQTYGETSKKDFIIRIASENLQLDQYKPEFEKALSGLSSADKPARIRTSEDRMYVVFDKNVEVASITQAFSGLSNQSLKVQTVSSFGAVSNHEYMVQFYGAGNKIAQALETSFGKANVEVLQMEEVGQKVGSELRTQALGAVLISIILILIYVWFRFDFEFAPGAILALVHDAVAILGIFSLFRVQFDLSTIAAVLTIIGFSINDTIVTYDRVRENIKLKKVINFPTLINDSINETLGRTILTSLTVFFACLILYFFGGTITQNFALALGVGILSGTYSTIFVAAPFTIYVHNYMQRKK
jgi:preprotein translocase subunit SecF